MVPIAHEQGIYIQMTILNCQQAGCERDRKGTCDDLQYHLLTSLPRTIIFGYANSSMITRSLSLGQCQGWSMVAVRIEGTTGQTRGSNHVFFGSVRSTSVFYISPPILQVNNFRFPISSELARQTKTIHCQSPTKVSSIAMEPLRLLILIFSMKLPQIEDIAMLSGQITVVDSLTHPHLQTQTSNSPKRADSLLKWGYPQSSTLDWDVPLQTIYFGVTPWPWNPRCILCLGAKVTSATRAAWPEAQPFFVHCADSLQAKLIHAELLWRRKVANLHLLVLVMLPYSFSKMSARPLQSFRKMCPKTRLLD